MWPTITPPNQGLNSALCSLVSGLGGAGGVRLGLGVARGPSTSSSLTHKSQTRLLGPDTGLCCLERPWKRSFRIILPALCPHRLPVTFQPGGPSISLRKAGAACLPPACKETVRQSRPPVGRWLAGTCWPTWKPQCSLLEDTPGSSTRWQNSLERGPDKEGKTHCLPSWGGGGMGTDVLLDLGSSHCQRWRTCATWGWPGWLASLYHCMAWGTRGGEPAGTSQGLPGSCILHRAQRRRRKEGIE